MTHLTTNKFIERARLAHGDYYDYSEVEYVRSSLPVVISCPKHGRFEKWPTIHLRGSGCLECELEEAEKESALSATQTHMDPFRKTC
jgi:hypothetical protein